MSHRNGLYDADNAGLRLPIVKKQFIDALTSREPYREVAEQIFLYAVYYEKSMYITASSATDIYYLVRKHLHSTSQAKNAMAKLYELFQILDVDSL